MSTKTPLAGSYRPISTIGSYGKPSTSRIQPRPINLVRPPTPERRTTAEAQVFLQNAAQKRAEWLNHITESLHFLQNQRDTLQRVCLDSRNERIQEQQLEWRRLVDARQGEIVRRNEEEQFRIRAQRDRAEMDRQVQEELFQRQREELERQRLDEQQRQIQAMEAIQRHFQEAERRQREELEQYQRIQHEGRQRQREELEEYQRIQHEERQRQERQIQEAERRRADEAAREALREGERLRRERQEQQRREQEEEARRARLRQCLACMEDADMDDMIELACMHWYCRQDIQSKSSVPLEQGLTTTGAFEAALRARQPFECCNQAVPIRLYANAPRDFRPQYERMQLERATPNPLYCANQRCGQFIPPTFHQGPDEAMCDQCDRITCRLCRNTAHGNNVCPQDEGARQVEWLANDRGWRRCPGCGEMVERDYGCNHMTCRCGSQWCYVCAAQDWRNCSH
ncbi:MAG: hypothetical protein M1822_003682 [Bathelium mastoideum]|nr:MAG: hypothetical protein M1822_003682 [Bathelium mastoideum]